MLYYNMLLLLLIIIYKWYEKLGRNPDEIVVMAY